MNNSDRLYKDIMQEELNALNRRLERVLRDKYGISGHLDVRYFNTRGRRAFLSDRIATLSDEIENFTTYDPKNRITNYIDNIVARRETRSSDIADTIDRLRHLRDTVTDCCSRRRIDKSIEYQQEKLRKMRRTNTYIDIIQRTFVMPRRRIDSIRTSMYMRAESKFDVFAAKHVYTESARRRLDPANHITHRALDFVYGVRSRYYEFRGARINNVLDQMNSTDNVAIMASSNFIVLGRDVANFFRDRVNNIRGRAARRAHP